MTEHKRLNFQCWNCKEKFSLSLEISGEPKLTVPCPYCGAECIADLAPFRDDTVEVLRSGETRTTGTAWNFPPVIPTTAPDQTD